MRKLLLCLVLCLLLPLGARAEGMRVLFAADVHLGGAKAGTQENADTEALLYRLAQRAESADALLLLGDVTNNAHPEEREQLRTLLSAIAAQGVRVYVLPGNHDLSSETSAEFAAEMRDYGWAQATAVEPETQSYCAPLSVGWRVLMLNTASPGEAAGTVGEDLLAWVQSQLNEAKAQGERVLVCGHHPLLAHSVGEADRGDLTAGREKLAALLAQTSVPLYLAGHRHIGHWAQAGGLTEILAGKLDDWPMEAGMLSQEGETLRFERVALTAAGEPLQSRKEAAFTQKARSMATLALAGTSMAEDEAMVDWFEQVYGAYLRGKLCETRLTLAADPAFARWQSGEITSIFRPWTAFLMAEMTEDYSALTVPIR